VLSSNFPPQAAEIGDTPSAAGVSLRLAHCFPGLASEAEAVEEGGGHRLPTSARYCRGSPASVADLDAASAPRGTAP
jgi:hypothetical protein